ncbi:AAA family ATPase [Streptomyces sp. NPDC057702]|uniref:AAA family ATPase n=1 Tax=unclassified Streptomyces TaxID=2593676 RepID=UPI003680D607
MPGSGKSTVAPLVAEHYERAAHISGDVLSYMVVRGRVGFLGEPAAESRRQAMLGARNMCALAANFAEHDILPVIEHTIADREMLDAMVGWLRPRPVRFVVLAPPLAVCRERNARRPERARVHFDFAPQYERLRARLGDTGWWLDTATQTPRETAAAIAAHAHERATL